MARHLHVLEQEEQLTDELDPAYEPLFHVVLLDDDHHSDTYVIEMLGRLVYIPAGEGARHAAEVDATGRTIVLTCELPQAEFARDQIHGYGRDPRIQACKGSMSATVEPAEVAK